MSSRLSVSVITVVCCCLLSNGAQAQSAELNWAEKMFSDLKVDFGTVARGADTRTEIVVENLYEEDVTLIDVDTTCGCTAAKPDRTLLKTHEKARIEVVMDTRKFMHRKDSNVDVTLQFHGANGMSTKTVRVPITAYIRSDVVLTPGNADFGTVGYGEPAVKTIEVAYAGRSDWEIRDVQTGNDHIQADFVETARGNGRVSYQLTVRLDENVGIGPIQDKIYLLTDDTRSPEVPVLVTGRVAPDIEIVPSELRLGSLAPGEVKQFSVVVKGRRPFAIEDIECDAYPESFEIRPPGDDQKPVHVVPFRVTAPEQPGDFSETFTVTIAGRPEPVTFSANGTIQAAN